MGRATSTITSNLCYFRTITGWFHFICLSTPSTPLSPSSTTNSKNPFTKSQSSPMYWDTADIVYDPPSVHIQCTCYVTTLLNLWWDWLHATYFLFNLLCILIDKLQLTKLHFWKVCKTYHNSNNIWTLGNVGEVEMTESAQCAAYNIGIAQDDSLELVSEAARRLAAVTVPLLCGLVVLHAME